MKFILNVTLEELEDKINRQILVDENIELADMCEYIIISMKGHKMPLYTIVYNNAYYSPILDDEEEMIGLLLKDLKLKKKSKLRLIYNSKYNYNFNIQVEKIIKEPTENEETNFKILSGKGYGIINNGHAYDLFYLLTNKKLDKYYTKTEKEYLQKRFILEEVNKEIENYKEYRNNIALPKQYIFNISLEGFNKEIKRKILVNNNIKIYDFCRKVIKSMNGDLSHCFSIRKEKNYLDEIYEEAELYYLDLKEKQRFKIIYDFGDNWVFNVTLSKIINEKSEVDFKVLSGKGYGIIDDCGGIWGLEDIFSGKNKEWGEYDIEEFDLEECNNMINKV